MAYKILRIKKKHTNRQSKSNNVQSIHSISYSTLDALKELYSNSPIPFTLIKVICDETGVPVDRQFVYINQAAAILEQAQVSEYIGKRFSELFPTTAAKHLDEYAEVAYSGTVKVIAGYSPKLQKYLSIQCYQPELGYCACILSDVTEEKKTKNQLQVIMDNMVGAVSIYDPEMFPNGLIYLSNSLYTLTGYTIAEQSGTGLEFCFIGEKTRQEIYRKMKVAFESMQKLDLVFDVRHKNGTKLWLRYSAQPVNNDGKTLYYGFIIDATSEYEAKLELEDKYNKALTYRRGAEDSGYLSTYVVNLSTNTVVEQSRNFAANSPIKDGASYNELLPIIFPVDENKQYLERFAQDTLVKAFEHGENYFKEVYLSKNSIGKRSWIKTVVKMAKSPNNGDLIAFFHSYDVHKQKISGDMVISAANKLFDMIIYIDSITQEFVCYLHGQTQSFTLDDFDFYVSNTIEEMKQEYCTINSQELIEKLKLRYVCKELEDKEEYCQVAHLSTENDSNMYKKIMFRYLDKKIGTIMMVMTDVTDIYQHEMEQKELLHHALSSAEQANAAKTAFLSNMSHDIRTPMNAILGMTELAMLDIDNKERIEESLEIIHSSSQHLLDLVNDVLEMSKIENNTMVLVKEDFSLDAVIHDINKIMIPLFEKKQQHYETKLDVIHDNVNGDSLRLRRVLINLLNNASKFTPNEGTIKLLVEEQPLPKNRLVNIKFTVEDNGIGISEDHQTMIFDAFSRDSTTDSYRIEGTGLGLAIVKSIVDSSGGIIRVDSTVGVGSSFVVELMYKVAKNKLVTPVEKQTGISENFSESSLKGTHILLVEDHYVNIAVACKMLEKMGALVTTATDGEQGCALFKNSSEGAFDLILMDIQMPKMDGYQATKHIRRSHHPQAKTIPIIAMTANVYADDIEQALKCGMNGHIGKPISTKMLATTINKHLREDRGGCNDGKDL